MNWPPNKSWTSTSPVKGFRHFVAINYGGEGPNRWVSLVAVLDGTSTALVPWEQLKDKKKWLTGWLHLNREESNLVDNYEFDSNNSLQGNLPDGCLHPSDDSGLCIPSRADSIRPWS